MHNNGHLMPPAYVSLPAASQIPDARYPETAIIEEALGRVGRDTFGRGGG